MLRVLLVMAFALLLGAAPMPDASVPFSSFADQFDRFEEQTAGMQPDARVAAFRAEFDGLVPGLYADKDEARLNLRIAKALDGFPAIRPAYRSVANSFPANLDKAVRNFRRIFPGFVSPMPIMLTHQLGMRDGGSDFIAGRKVMLFGADVIAQIHNDDSIQPFLEHELFHLEHARHFADCDQLWCPLWQEGLATYAASVMTPGASDHQLLLDQPQMIRTATDARWGAALCWFAGRFDSAETRDTYNAFNGGIARPGFPPRFGYYVGLLVAAEMARNRRLPQLSGLSDSVARPLVVGALTSLMREAHAPCAAPKAKGPITHVASRPA